MRYDKSQRYISDKKFAIEKEGLNKQFKIQLVLILAVDTSNN